MLKGRKIIVGVTGGIAAYKAAELIRLLVKSSAQVRVVMTPAATEFVTPLTFQALSGNPVGEALLNPEAEAGMGHIELARWADLILVAPASADFIARFTMGMANDLLSTLCLASEAAVMLAPAMNQRMWGNSATQENMTRLSKRIGAGEVIVVGPASGEQACGDVGAGRMEEPAVLVEQVDTYFGEPLLQGKRIVITAGPTREALDPVRYLSNHSSGKMGYALAEVAVQMGADVELISGPVVLPAPSHLRCVKVTSAVEMLEASQKAIETSTDIFIAAAAVADYRPAAVSEQKMKKKGDDALQLTLVQNPDIVAAIASTIHSSTTQSSSAERIPFMVGFAAETQNVKAYARGKLERKGLDMVIANDVSDQRIGFNSDENEVIVIEKNAETHFPIASKQRLAKALLEHIAGRLAEIQK